MKPYYTLDDFGTKEFTEDYGLREGTIDPLIEYNILDLNSIEKEVPENFTKLMQDIMFIKMICKQSKSIENIIKEFTTKTFK